MLLNTYVPYTTFKNNCAFLCFPLFADRIPCITTTFFYYTCHFNNETKVVSDSTYVHYGILDMLKTGKLLLHCHTIGIVT